MSRFLASMFVLGLASVTSCARAQASHVPKHVAGDAEAGQTTFQHYCVMCHAVTPDTKIVGPSLYSEMRGPHAKSSAAVHEVIVHGKGLMPALGTQLSEQDVADLLAYVRKQ